DVLADLAARAHLNLIADDYTETWPRLEGHTGAQSLSRWLAVIRDEYGFEPVRDGSFLRIRNRHWWLDRPREIPIRLLNRWARLLRGTSSDRLAAAAEVARLAPLSLDPVQLGDRLHHFAASPE